MYKKHKMYSHGVYYIIVELRVSPPQTLLRIRSYCPGSFLTPPDTQSGMHYYRKMTNNRLERQAKNS